MEMLDEIVSEFLVESYESLDQLDRDLLALEDTPDDLERMASIFRTVHTIKGTAGFLAFPALERLAHVGENLLVPLRDGDLQLSNEIADALLAMVDGIRSILANIESSQSEGDETYEGLIDTLARLKDGPQTAEIPVEEVVSSLTEGDDSSAAAPEAEANLEADSVAAPTAETAAVEAESDSQSTDILTAPEPAPITVDADTRSLPSEGGGPPKKSVSASVADSTVRIDVTLLDRLMNLVGELVLARNQIMQYSQNSEDQGLCAASQRVNLITTELQEGVMKTRMQPIRNAWSKLPRVVRDLSHSCGKNVQVKMEGEDTELDKTIVEAIRDPLTHIVRNSVDHGIESPADREAAGKPAEGTLLLRAYHEGGQVIIEIVDDGGGINVNRVRDKAVEKGLISGAQAAAMSDREATQLILLPGFSTAAKVTNVSGRGVGMDVVKTNVEKIGGTLDIQSEPGRSTTLRIKIPLTLAIIPALAVRCGENSFCLPQISLLELVRLEEERARSEIEILHSVPVYRLRGNLLPLVYLDEELGLRPRRTDEDRRNTSAVNIVVLQAEDRQFGLIVDEVHDTQEIVVKPLGQHLKHIPVYAGSTIMGDGTVSLILDVIGVAQQSNVLTEHASHRLGESTEEVAEGGGDLQSLLIVEPADGTRAAIPLSLVSRLEEIPVDRIEQCGGRSVLQYRGEVMPLISVCDSGQIEDRDGKVSLVVYNNGRNVGVAVGGIVDIVEHVFGDDDEGACDRPQIIAGRVTRVIDLAGVAATA